MPCMSKSFSAWFYSSNTFTITAPITSKYGFSIIVTSPSIISAGYIWYTVKVNGTVVDSGSSPITNILASNTIAVFAKTIGEVQQGSTVSVSYTLIGIPAGATVTVTIGYLDPEEYCTYIPALNIPILNSIKDAVCVNFTSGKITIYAPYPSTSSLTTQPEIPCLAMVPISTIPITGTLPSSGTAQIIFEAQGPFSQLALSYLNQALPDGTTIGNATILNKTISGNSLIANVEIASESQFQAISIAIAIAIVVVAVLVGIALYQVIIKAPKQAVGNAITAAGIGLGVAIALIGLGIGGAIIAWGGKHSR